MTPVSNLHCPFLNSYRKLLEDLPFHFTSRRKWNSVDHLMAFYIDKHFRILMSLCNKTKKGTIAPKFIQLLLV